MASFKNILVAIDGSENSTRAAVKAAEIAISFRARLVLLNVIVPTESAYYKVKPTTDEEEWRRGEQRMTRAKKAVEEIGITPELKVILGNPAEAILDISEEGYDLVMLGSRGLNAVERFIMGSVSTRVVQHSRIPVMVVP